MPQPLGCRRSTAGLQHPHAFQRQLFPQNRTQFGITETHGHTTGFDRTLELTQDPGRLPGRVLRELDRCTIERHHLGRRLSPIARLRTADSIKGWSHRRWGMNCHHDFPPLLRTGSEPGLQQGRKIGSRKYHHSLHLFWKRRSGGQLALRQLPMTKSTLFQDHLESLLQQCQLPPAPGIRFRRIIGGHALEIMARHTELRLQVQQHSRSLCMPRPTRCRWGHRKQRWEVLRLHVVKHAHPRHLTFLGIPHIPPLVLRQERLFGMPHPRSHHPATLRLHMPRQPLPQSPPSLRRGHQNQGRTQIQRRRTVPIRRQPLDRLFQHRPIPSPKLPPNLLTHGVRNCSSAASTISSGVASMDTRFKSGVGSKMANWLSSNPTGM